ncbi:MAG: phenylalanine--tRNA ligase subunit beta [Minisyncoccales bacterium]
MANIKIPKKLFEKEIGKLTDEMEHKIAMFGTPVEEITEDEVELEIFPNRPDLLSYQGFKRSFLSFIEKKRGLKQYKIYKPEKDYKVYIESSVKNIRPYTACAIVKGLKFNDEKIKELVDVQEKLHSTLGRKRKKIALGIYPLEKIKPPITFKAIEPDKIKFVPLESEKEMSGLEILQRHSTGREYAHLLAGKQKFPIFVDSENKILSMPPIINSQETGKITEKTREVFIECSGFNFEILKKCLNIITSTLAEMGGKVYQMELKYSRKEITPDFTPEKMKLSTKNTNKLLGLELNEKQIKRYLEKMGHNYNPKTKEVEIPAWRTDILHEVDLIEDIAIAYGYDNFEPEIPNVATIGEENFEETIKRKISEILSGIQMLEISNYHLTTKKDQYSKMNINLKQIKEFLEVETSKTDYSLLRENLAHYALKILSENIDSEYPQKIFETGRIFYLDKENNKIKEKENLCFAITPGNFTEAKQILEYLFRMLGFETKFREAEEFPNHFVNGRTAEILFKNKPIGYLGEIHPSILKNWRIKMPVSLCEIELKEIFNELKD